MTTSVKTSRRDFLKGAGLFAAAGAAAAVVGCSPSTSGSTDTQDSSSSASADTLSWDEEFDVVIVGAGVAGLSAAITAATESDSSKILLIEKGSSCMGNSPFSNGGVLFTDAANETRFAHYVKQLIANSPIPGEVIDAYAHEAASLYDWVIGLGAIREEMIFTEVGKMNLEWPEFDDADSYGMFNVGHAPNAEITGAKHIFSFLQDVMMEHADAIDYRTDTTFERLVVDGEGAVAGIVANGKSYKAAKGVVMACGGFENNPEMMENYFRMGYVNKSGGDGNTGDGHKALTKIGAAFWRMHAADGFWMHPRDLANTTNTISAAAMVSGKSNGITVGMNGRRFYMDNDGFWVNDPTASHDRPLVQSVGCRHGLMQIGGEWGQYAMPHEAWFIYDADGLAAGAVPQATIDNLGMDKIAYSADTLTELAAKVGLPEGELEKTVGLWNQFCDNGEDLAFYRPATTLTKIATAPFYAQLCAPTMLTTNGGPVKNERCQVIDLDGNVIKGLYACGEFGSAGMNNSEAICTGRLAGRQAANA